MCEQKCQQSKLAASSSFENIKYASNSQLVWIEEEEIIHRLSLQPFVLTLFSKYIRNVRINHVEFQLLYVFPFQL